MNGSVYQTPGSLLNQIRSKKPVVHSITNFVVMNSTANVLLAMGASPIMAHAPEEMEDLSRISDALVINIGTLSLGWIESMHKACQTFREVSKPIVLDPVGAGATQLRTDTARELISLYTPTVVRGNASEILSLSLEEGSTRGVDTVHGVDDAMNQARAIAEETGCVIAVTGERDYLTDGARSVFVSGGDPMMQYVTGTGCAASVIVAAFVAVGEDPLMAAASALAFFGLAAQKAIKKSQGPGSFWMHTLDALHGIEPAELDAEARIDVQ
jgi:hydroxyethylthiazole kinase|uniref:Hydroxyethylthiazole kinase n=1 Tax=Desulfomonile tiedjei TaxID=2358 RepID=A0A7C4ARJ0_9BACT